MQTSQAPNTAKAYRFSWRIFERWCTDAGRDALPAHPESVLLAVVWCLQVRRYRIETVRIMVSAIRDKHRRAGFPDPVEKQVGELLSAAVRAIREEPAGKAALTLSQLRRICALPGESTRDLRDRAVVLTGFASGWRRAELSSLNLADVAFVEQGLVLRLRRSKTDQTGRGHIVGIPFGRRRATCPVRALQAWLRVRGDWQGPLFCRFDGFGTLLHKRLGPQGIYLVVKHLIERIGDDPTLYGAHSLRAGMITAATENDASDLRIMKRSGHRSLKTLLRYFRPSDLFRNDPLKGVL